MASPGFKKSEIPSVVVLGATGMLGHTILRVMTSMGCGRLRATFRPGANPRAVKAAVSAVDVDWVPLEATTASSGQLKPILAGHAWAINCIGVIKGRIHDDKACGVEQALRVNALFPFALAQAASDTGTRVLQIATDCVFSGQRGNYIESDAHDPLDVYGKTKSLGEAAAPSVLHLRCSIVGPECGGFHSLQEWFRRQPKGATVSGFVDHYWNGITTYHFARICQGIIQNPAGTGWAGLQHVVPADAISKCELLNIFRVQYGRTDIHIIPRAALAPVNRTLATRRPLINRLLWRQAGIINPPPIAAMIAEASEWHGTHDSPRDGAA